MPKTFYDRHFPVRPNLDQLRHQAKDLLRAIRGGDARAVAELQNIIPGLSTLREPSWPTLNSSWLAVMVCQAGRDWSPPAS